jgi:hypothetical protein
MANATYPLELYNHDEGSYRVTFSPEEHQQLLDKGWDPLPKEDVKYVSHTAIAPKGKPASAPVRTCTRCGKPGHNAATCPEKATA